MRLTLRLAAAVVIGVYTLTLPSVQASALPIREATRATVRGVSVRWNQLLCEMTGRLLTDFSLDFAELRDWS